jgi:CYTH domain-containing protein
VEIERKFVVENVPANWKRAKSSRIVQGYLPLVDSGLEIRLRRKGAQRVLKIKAGHGRSRLEEEINVSDRQFRALWPLTQRARIAKRRYKVDSSGHVIEMDVYEGPLRGLITAEVEFKTHRESRLFRPPTWLSQEVTGNRRFSNQVLARRQRLPFLRKVLRG